MRWAIAGLGTVATTLALGTATAAGADPGFTHVFRRDLQTGALTVVDAGANGTATDPDISNDGRFVIFASDASNLVPADPTRDPDVFLADLETGAIRLMS